MGMLLSVIAVVPAHGGEPVTLDNVVTPAANVPDEPLAERFSREQASHFLDSAAVSWQKDRNCMTCHTNYLYLMARPTLGSDVPAHATVRAYAEELITKRWPEKGPRWDAEVLMTGAILALNDRATTGKLHPLTRAALDRGWTLQKEDGGFDWLKCEWPPMESDDHFGATMVAIGVGAAPEAYAETPAAQAGLAKLRQYFQSNPAPTLHHRLMLVWASTLVPDLLREEERAKILEEVWPLQHADGGWGLAQLGNWEREDGSPQDTDTSDGYGTGFVIYVARQAGVPASDPRLGQAVGWLKSNQRASGRWFTRSVHADGRHFISHAGTSMAILALDACGALDEARAQCEQ